MMNVTNPTGGPPKTGGTNPYSQGNNNNQYGSQNQNTNTQGWNKKPLIGGH